MTATSEGLSYLPWNNELEILEEANYYNNQIKELYHYEKEETVLSAIKNEIDEGKKSISIPQLN